MANVNREPSGRVARETAAEIKAVAESQPHRRKLPEFLRGDPRAGSVIGRMFLAGQCGDHAIGITQRQHDAAEIFAQQAHTYFRIVLGTSPTAPKPLSIDGGGASLAPEPSPEKVMAIRENWNDMMRAITEAGYRDSGALLIRVILRDEFPSFHECGDLRAMLNALANLWKLPENDRVDPRISMAVQEAAGAHSAAVPERL